VHSEPGEETVEVLQKEATVTAPETRCASASSATVMNTLCLHRLDPVYRQTPAQLVRG